MFGLASATEPLKLESSELQPGSIIEGRGGRKGMPFMGDEASFHQLFVSRVAMFAFFWCPSSL